MNLLDIVGTVAGLLTKAIKRPPITHVDGTTLEIDARGIPTNACLVCGCNVFNIRAGFEDYDIAFWFTDAECAECGCPLTAPTPCDHPDQIDA